MSTLEEAIASARDANRKIDRHEGECAIRWREVDKKLDAAAEQRRDQSNRIDSNAELMFQGLRDVRRIMITAAFTVIGAMGSVAFFVGTHYMALLEHAVRR